MVRSMADLEKLVVSRDKRFVVRLVLGLAGGVLLGLVIIVGMGKLDVGGCAAGAFEDATHAQPADGAE
jgi:hypothetical protein